MKSKLTLFSVIIVFSIIIRSFLNTPQTSSRDPQGAFDNIPLVGFLANGVSIATDVIYKTGSTAVEVPYQITKELIIKMGLNVYLGRLVSAGHLDKETSQRVLARVRDPSFGGKVLPFLFALKNQYTSEDSSIERYQEFARKHYPQAMRKNKWNTHSHFKWKDLKAQKEKEKDNGIDKGLIGAAIKIFDIIFIQGDSLIESDLSKPYVAITLDDVRIIDQVQTIVKQLLSKIHPTMDDGDFKDMVSFMLQDSGSGRQRLQAATISVIDFIKQSVHKAYRYHSIRYSRQEDLKNWMLKTFKEDSKKLISYLDYANKERKYAVHVTVDGLQGSLAKSLAEGKKGDVFLAQTLKDHEQRSLYRPKNTHVKSPDYDYTWEFLGHLQKNGHSNKHFMPYFKSIYSNYGKSIAKGGISTTPTISVRNLPIVKTGAGVAGEGSTGLPNFHFVDRPSQRAYYFYGNDALQLDKLTNDAGMKTMFERLNQYNTLNCNAQYDFHAHASFDGFANLGLGESVRDFGDYLCMVELNKRAKIEKKLRSQSEDLLQKIKAYRSKWGINIPGRLALRKKIKDLIQSISSSEVDGMPQYLLYYNPWPDHFSHYDGPFSNDIISPTGEYNRLDYWLGVLAKAYKKAGIHDRTLFAMAGDHGLAPLFYYLNPEKAVFQNLSKELGVEISILKISSDEGEGPKITNALNPPRLFEEKTDVVVASTAGGNFMLDFFNSYTDFKTWQTQPLYQDLITWRPYQSPANFKVDIVDILATKLKESLAYLVVREEYSDLEGGKVRLIAHREGTKYTEFITREKDKIYYQSSNGDLLDLKKLSPYSSFTEDEEVLFKSLYKRCVDDARQEDRESWCSVQEWRKLASFTPRPDSVVQISHLYDSQRAGTINLFPKDGIGYNTTVPGRHAGEHFHEKDAFVGFWGRPVKDNKKQLQNVVNGSIAPTLFEYLNSESPGISEYMEKGKNGWGFESVYSRISGQ